MRSTLVVALALLVAPASSPSSSGSVTESSQDADFHALVDDFLDFYFYFNPTEATELGIHDFDGRLPDVSQTGLFSLMAAYEEWLGRLAAIDRDGLTGDAFWDYRVLEYGLRDALLELQEVRYWEKNPLFYVDLVTGGLSSLASRHFAPADERLEAVISRQRQVPELLSQARRNLLGVPQVYARLGLEATRGAVTYVRDQLPGAFRSVPPGALRDEFEVSNRRTVEELRRFANWLETELSPRANGDFRLGSEVYRAKLRFQEHLDQDPRDLLELARSESRRYRRWIESEAGHLDPTRSATEVIKSLGADHPPADSLIPVARGMMEKARDFVLRQDLLTLPTDRRPEVGPTPPYRVGSLASMSAPGAMEERADEAFYYVKLPEPGWSSRQVQEHLSVFSRPALMNITVHETFPGHYVQLAYGRDRPSRIRKLFRTASLVEGWAHYVEEMMLDEGFGGGDPAGRVAQLQAALLRLARFQAGIALHAEGASLAEAERIFRETAFLEPFPARREAERGTYDPLYGYYSWGKLQILALRADYQEHLSENGETYVLANFHNRFLRLGLPIPMARQVLIPGDQRSGLR